MKAAPFILACLALTALPPALPHGPAAAASGPVEPTTWPPYVVAEYRLDGVCVPDVTLLLTDRVVAIQLSDRTLHRVERKLHREREDQDNPIAQAIEAVVLGGVRTMLHHSAECRIRDLSDVEYRDGELVLVTQNGETLFENMEINKGEVMQGFSEPDARAFVREFRRLKARTS